ncbi:MAG: hypothetical protein V1652_00040 [bacterium]
MKSNTYKKKITEYWKEDGFYECKLHKGVFALIDPEQEDHAFCPACEVEIFYELHRHFNFRPNFKKAA